MRNVAAKEPAERRRSQESATKTNVLLGQEPAIGEPERGWYSRGYLPHFDQPGLVQAITFRLADALPAAQRAEWKDVLASRNVTAQRRKIEDYLDAGYGSCHLRDERVARIVEHALLCFDGRRYRLIAWVIMPNHVHVVIEMPGAPASSRHGLRYPLAAIMHSWKSFTAKEANRILVRSGVFWQREYFDRFIRDTRHLRSAILYVHNNPVKARLVQQAEDWPYSSARRAGGTPALPE